MKKRFADFEFDPSTGELTQTTNGNVTVGRLPPQPSQLLELLLKHHPGIASHQAIGEELWPGIGVDYEANLHFCIRQIRSALNDSASSPKFVETIPRRGYRWIAEFNCIGKEVQPARSESDSQSATEDSQGYCNLADDDTTLNTNASIDDRAKGSKGEIRDSFVEPFDDAATINKTALDSSIDNNSETHAVNRRIMFGIFFIVTMVFVLFFVQAIFKTPYSLVPQSTDKPRIAIMPFTTNKTEFESIGTGEIGWQILKELEFGELNVVGPTTTSRFDGTPKLMWDLVDEFKIDLIVNGKFYLEKGKPVILAEIIRTTDGAHIWVERFLPSEPPDEIIRSIVDAINGSTD